MADVLVIHDHGPLRASKVDSLRTNGDRAFEATDLGRACVGYCDSSVSFDVVVVASGGGSAVIVAEVKTAWPSPRSWSSGSRVN